jgi:hypothetical protein
VLWTASTEQRKALSMRYALGYINKDGTLLSRVREADFSSNFPLNLQTPVQLFERGIYTPLRPQSTAASFDTHTAIQGDHLIVKHYIKPAPGVRHLKSFKMNDNIFKGEKRAKASWVAAIDAMATATHIGRGHDLTVMQEREMARRLHDSGLEMSWVDRLPSVSTSLDPKVLLATSGNEKLRLFSVSGRFEKLSASGNCFTVVVRHNAPLISCIERAEKTRHEWAIVV